MDTVGQRIKRIRKMRRWTQKELAERASIHVISLKNYELITLAAHRCIPVTKIVCSAKYNDQICIMIHTEESCIVV